MNRRKTKLLVFVLVGTAGAFLVWPHLQRKPSGAECIRDSVVPMEVGASGRAARASAADYESAIHGPISPGTTEYLLMGFVPYQSDGDLEAMGFSTAEQKALARQLYARTFFELVAKLAGEADVSSTPGKALLRCELSDETHERIKGSFFAGIQEILGQPAYDKLLDSDRLHYIDAELLGFGEFPVMMQLTTEASPAGEPQIRFTFSTQLANSMGGTDAYFRAQRLPVAIINEKFAAVREATKGSEFVWPK